MKHFLESTYQEIQDTSSRIEKLKTRRVLFFFPRSFKRQYIQYAHFKKTFLLNYSSLFSDIQKDFSTENIVTQEIENIKNSIVYITDTTELCTQILHTLKSNIPEEKSIIEHEKKFLITAITAFHTDLKLWMQNHSQELSQQISKLDSLTTQASEQSHKAILKLQIKRLELQIQNMSHMIK